MTTEITGVIECELQSHWEAELASPTRKAYEGRRLLSVAPIEAYAGVDQIGGRRFVAIRLDSGRRKLLAARFPRSSKGILVENVEQGGGRITFFLREEAGVPRAVFPAVMLDVLVAGDGAAIETAARATLERFSSWQAALSRQAGGMTAAEVRGILGELIVARDVIEPELGTAALIEAWRAPDDDHIHDFVGATWELEVKTAITPATHFHVSAEGQLEPAATNRMFLAAVELEPASEGTSLSGIVEQMLSRPGATDDLTEALRNAFIRRGAMVRTTGGEAVQQYRVVAVEQFEVRDGFPLLLRKTMPGGVSSLRYQVSFSACKLHKIDRGVLSNAITNQENAQ